MTKDWRFDKVASAAVIFIFHVIDGELTAKLPDLWDMTFVVIYPACFFASLILAITRIMNVIPNPKPIIPLAISVTGWATMLIGAILAMRHANLKLHIEIMTDDEVAMDPIFRHDLLLCSFSLVGSSLYLVHAWLCYDCWQWGKREKKTEETTNALRTAGSNSGSSRSSNRETEPKQNPKKDDPSFGLPSTSSAQSGKTKSLIRGSRLLNKPKKPSETMVEEIDTLATLNEMLRSSALKGKQINVEDEPVRLYCCCVDLCQMIKQEYKVNVPAHEFQVVHVM